MKSLIFTLITFFGSIALSSGVFQVMGQSLYGYKEALAGAEKHAREHCGSTRKPVRVNSWTYKYDVNYVPAPGCNSDEPRYCPETPIPTYTATANFRCQ